jgi:hypothetical protein
LQPELAGNGDAIQCLKAEVQQLVEAMAFFKLKRHQPAA